MNIILKRFRILSIVLILVSVVLYLVNVTTHWDLPLDLFIPLVLSSLLIFQIVTLAKGNLPFFKSPQNLAIGALILSSLYHLSKHALSWENAPLLIGECTIIALIIMIEADENAKFTALNTKMRLIIIPLAIIGDVIVNAYGINTALGIVVQTAQLIVFSTVLLFTFKELSQINRNFPVRTGFIVAVFLTVSVCSAMFSLYSTSLVWQLAEIYLKWISYLMLIDLLLSSLPSVLDRTLRQHKLQLFIPFKYSTVAHLLVECHDGSWTIIDANQAAITLLCLNAHDLNQVAIKEHFTTPDILTKVLDSETTRVFTEIPVKTLEKTVFYADIQTQTIAGDYGDLMIIDIRDVSQRREILKKVALRESVFINVAESILITDSNQRILDINPSFIAFYGFSRDELIGQKPDLIKSGLIGYDFYKTMWHEISSKGYFNGEFVNRKKDGQLITVFQSVSKIIMDENEIYYVSVASDISTKKASEALVFNLAFRDPVTQLFNKTYLLQQDQHRDYHVAILFTLRDFKILTSYYDSSFIDSLMSTLVRKLEALVSEGTLFKWSEDQILVFLTEKNFYEVNESLYVAKLHEHLKEHLYIMQKSIHPLISTAWIIQSHTSLFSDLSHLEAATTYLLTEKHQCIQYNVDLEKKFERNRQVEILLNNAIASKELFVLYQPIIDIKTSTVKGAEALVRWQSPTLGIVRPDEFISIAERTHLIMDLGYFVANEAMKVLSNVLNHHPNFVMAFNVSIVQLMDPHFSTQIHHLAIANKVRPPSLCIEITESQYLGLLEVVQDNLSALRTAGFQLSIDDFGTGYSSLSRIKDLHASYIKIDKVFFDDIESSISATLLTNGILAFADQMGFNIIAEGIETLEQLIYLKNKSVRYVQGYVFSYPISEAQLNEFLEKPFSLDRYLIDEFDDDFKLIQKLDSRISAEVLKRQNVSSILLDTSFNITSCSKTFLEQLAYESHDVIGSPLSKFLSTESKLFMDISTFEGSPSQQSNHFTQFTTALDREISVYMACRLNRTESGMPSSITCIIENLTDQNFDVESYMMEQESYINFFERAPLPSLVWNEDLTIQAANKEALKLFDHEHGSPHSLKLETLLGDDQSKEFHYHYNRVFAGYSQDSWIDVRSSTGKVRDMHWYSTPLMDQTQKVTQVLTILEDRTDLNIQTENAKLLRDAANLSDRIVIFTNQNHEIVFINQKGLDTFNIPEDPDKIFNLKDFSITFIGDSNAIIDLENIGDRLWSGIVRISSPDGITSLYDATRDTSKLENSRLEKVHLYSMRSKDQELKSSLELEHLRKSLTEQERLASIGELIAGVAHEINNPLSYMIGNADYLSKIQARILSAFKDDNDFSEDLQEVIQSFNDGLKAIKNIVSDLKIYSRKNINDEKSYHNLNDLIHLTLRIAHNEIKYSSLVQLELDENMPDLLINASKIQQVLLNLIINAHHAIKARWAGEMGVITISTSVVNDNVVCKISDNGTGMADNVMAHIFEAFYTTKETGIGTGLGLSVSKDIIETQHCGILTVSSTLGEGTCFTLHLPLVVENQAAMEDF